MTGREAAGAQLGQLIRQAMDEALSPDPAVVAELVLKQMTPRLMKEALAVCLPPYVRVQMASCGWHARAAGKKPMSTADRIRSWYAQQLGAPLFVAGAWKFLRDCTAEDLHTAAADRYRKATEVHAEGDRWTKLALFMDENDRTTVADVREDELKSLMEQS